MEVFIPVADIKIQSTINIEKQKYKLKRWKLRIYKV
jgi:hypothetical protein